MAKEPLTSPRLAPYGSELMFHPEATNEERRLARQAKHWPLGITITVAAECMIVLLCMQQVFVSPRSAPIAYVVLGVATVILLVAGCRKIIWPLWVRRKLLKDYSAFWLPPGGTRQFYEGVSLRIDNEVVSWHQDRLRWELYDAVRKMRIQEVILDGDNTYLWDDRRPETATVCRAHYAKLRKDMLKEVDKFCRGQTTEDK